MKINWFPGHMYKALKEMQSELKKVDIVLYVLDARIPLSSINPSLNKLIGGKKVLFVLNKIDMADEAKVKALSTKLVGENSDYIFFNSTSGKCDIVFSKVISLAKDKIEKYKAKGVNATIRLMVIGVPNSGKSTLVNNLCKKAKAETGNKAGVTKRGQWLSIGKGIEIFDTPGTLYPNLENQKVATNLALVGSVRDEVLDFVELANELIDFLKKNYLPLFEKRYPNCQTLDDIAKLRKCVMLGGELDIERTAYGVVDDFRKGRIGRITLD